MFTCGRKEPPPLIQPFNKSRDIAAMWQSSRKCACRRGLNSHEAAKPQVSPGVGSRLQATGSTDGKKPIKLPDCSQGRRERRPVQTHDEAARGGDGRLQRSSGRPVRARTSEEKDQRGSRSWAYARKEAKNSRSWPTLQGAERHAKSLAGAADAGYRDCSCSGAEREAESLACKCTLAHLPRALMPNPSLKRSANGRPPGPVWRYAVHFRQPGPGVLPSSTA